MPHSVPWPAHSLGEVLERVQAQIRRLVEPEETVDGPPTLVDVLPIDLVRGAYRDGCNCPIQRAIQRMLAPGWQVYVGPRAVLFHRRDEQGGFYPLIVRLPLNVRNFITWWDDPAQGILFKARTFRFPLYIPEECREGKDYQI